MQFSVLGGLELFVDGRRVPLGGRKQRALLALLLLNANEVVSRDRLVEGLWGERPPTTAERSLEAYVSRLRSLLGPDRIERRAPGYAIVVAAGEVDLLRFELLLQEGLELAAADDAAAALSVLERALELWRGPALADLLDEPFASREAERLEERRLLALETRITSQLAEGVAAGTLVRELERLVLEHPFRERFVENLMLALYREGRQADALAAYQDARLRLSGELGLEPGPQLRALEHEILAQDPRLMNVTPSPALRRPRRLRGRRRVFAAGFAAVAVAGGLAVGATREIRSDSGFKSNPTSARVFELGEPSPAHGADGALSASPAAMVSDGGSLWVAEPDAGAVVRVDRSSRQVVQRVTVGGSPGAVAVGGGAIWVAGVAGGRLTRIDPITETVTDHIDLAGVQTTSIAFGLGGLWVADSTDRSLLRLDPVTGATRRTVKLDATPTAIALGGRSIWIADYDAGSVSEVDARSGLTLVTIRVGNGPGAIAVAGESVWVANSLDSTVSRIDAVTSSVTDTIPVGSDPVSLIAGDRSVWVASRHAGTVSRIDRGSNTVTDVTMAGGAPTVLAIAGGRIWVGTRPQTSHRGGTLVLLHTSPISIDPALQLDVTPLQSDGLTRDGLVTYNHANGPEGVRLVPDLALNLPTPRLDGKIYTFRLRSGIRYSDGRPLRADDFRRALERLFDLHSPGSEYFSGIVGASACGVGSCDLSAGVVANDAAHTVTFRLTAPDPDFLQKLTIGGLASPVPAGTPTHAVRMRPIPGTGPYRIQRVGRDEIRYVRNRYFHEWSHAAQPDGNPDTIIMQFSLAASQEVRAIEADRADWTADGVPADLLQEVTTRYSSQLHSSPSTETDFLQLNTTAPPFNDLRVRRALNYAIDRGAIATFYGGTDAAVPTCQVLPPGLRGYRRYCPYGHRPQSNLGWRAPDLARARTLINASGTRGQPVTVWAASDASGPGRSIVEYTANILRKLGYRATARLVPSAYFGNAGPTFFRRIQITQPSWADNTAYNFFATWFTCSAAYNHRFFCDLRIDRAIRAAQTIEQTNPREAASLWAQLDRDLVDRAAWVPLVNPPQIDFVSANVRNYEHHPFLGVIVDQLWVR